MINGSVLDAWVDTTVVVMKCVALDSPALVLVDLLLSPRPLHLFSSTKAR